MKQLTKRVAVLAVAAGLTIGLVGCVGAPVVPPIGFAYTNIDAPLNLRGEMGSKRGESSVKSYAFLVSVGDASVKSAAAAGGISNVKHVDYDFYNFLGVYQRFTTVVYGD